MANSDSAQQNAIETFLAAPLQERFRQLKDAKVADALREYLGAAAYSELEALAARRDSGTLNANIAPNIIFVPGVMGSLLSSKRGGVWWIDARARNYINELRLAPDGTSDLKKEYGIRPIEVDISYMPFLTAIDERPDFNFESFPYDWRKPLTSSADGLRDLLDRLYADNDNNPVNIVAHSMGGLMTRAALAKHGAQMWPKINRIVFVATPHYGSAAIAGYLKNHFWGFELMSLLGLFLNPEAFRSMWGVLGMLPAPRGIYPGTRPGDPSPWGGAGAPDDYVHPCANFDLYDAEAWKLELSAQDTAQLQKGLDAAKRFHEEIHAAHQALKQDQRARMAVIAGVGYDTLFRLAYNRHFWGLWEHADKTTSRVWDDPHRDGDGRVPVASAALEHVGDTRYCIGVHGELPNYPVVYEDVFRWLKGEEMQLPDTPAGANAKHLAGPATPSAPGLGRVTTIDRAKGDPGYWQLHDDPQKLAALKQKLEADTLPEFNTVRIL